MSVNWTIASCATAPESLNLTFFDTGVVTDAAGHLTGQTCAAPAAAIAVALNPGESRTVTSQDPQICPSALTNPSAHTVAAAANSGSLVIARATNKYVTLPLA